MGKASDRFHSRYHFAFAERHSNIYRLLLFGKETHWQRSTLPIVMGFGQISSLFDINFRVLYKVEMLTHNFIDKEVILTISKFNL